MVSDSDLLPLASIFPFIVVFPLLCNQAISFSRFAFYLHIIETRSLFCKAFEILRSWLEVTSHGTFLARVKIIHNHAPRVDEDIVDNINNLACGIVVKFPK